LEYRDKGLFDFVACVPDTLRLETIITDALFPRNIAWSEIERVSSLNCGEAGEGKRESASSDIRD